MSTIKRWIKWLFKSGSPLIDLSREQIEVMYSDVLIWHLKNNASNIDMGTGNRIVAELLRRLFEDMREKSDVR